MNIDTTKMTDTHGYLEGSAEAADRADADKAIDYKRDVTRNYINLTPEQIDLRLGGSQYVVTRKYDGEMNVLFLDGDQAAIINRSGRIRTGIPCVEDAAAALRAAGVTQAVIPAELYLDETDGRTRVYQVMAALADKKQIASLRLAAFDILELDGSPYEPNSYSQTHAKLTEILAGAKLARPVLATNATSKAEVKQIFGQWVETDGAEGLVVRTELPLVFKIKPRHTIDVAVVGYSEGTDDQDGQVRSLLLAMMPAPGQYQIIGKTGTGFDEALKRDLLERMSAMTVESSYIEADSNHVAFHMIRPEIVIELMINEVLFDTLSGYIDNPVLAFENNAWVRTGAVHGISVVYPVFQRERTDKKAEYDDVRLEQINDFAYAPPGAAAAVELPKSDLLKRVVYTKQLGEKLMVLKFMVWRTNKPAPMFPGYVFHLTNYSSDRKDPLQREVVVSDDETQIMEIFEASLEANVKRGWILAE